MINYIEAGKNSLSSIIDSLSGKQVNISIAIYRDKNVDSIWYERNPNNLLQADNIEISGFLEEVKADGGGDLPESLYDGAWKTISELNWKAQGRTLVILTHAPPLDGDKTKYNIDNLINICKEKQVVP